MDAFGLGVIGILDGVRPAARRVVVFASVLAADAPRFAGRQVTACGRGIARRVRAFCAVALPMLGMFEYELRASMLRAVAYACVLAVMVMVAAEAITRSQISLVAEGADSEWLEVNRPLQAFALKLPEFEEQRYASWRHAEGGGRKDVLTFGDLGSSGATAVVELYRAGAEPVSTDDDITASIGALRLSARPALPTTIETKFGAVEAVPFVDHGPGGARQCLRFSRAFQEPLFELSGWFCNAGQDIVDHGMIACALDRLTLVSGGSDPKLGALFARAELKRTFCGQQSVFVAATPKRNDWIEAARDPKLRGRK